jgi:hypothetical protein
MPNIENSHTVTMHGNVLTLRGKNTDIGEVSNHPDYEKAIGEVKKLINI